MSCSSSWCLVLSMVDPCLCWTIDDNGRNTDKFPQQRSWSLHLTHAEATLPPEQLTELFGEVCNKFGDERKLVLDKLHSIMPEYPKLSSPLGLHVNIEYWEGIKVRSEDIPGMKEIAETPVVKDIVPPVEINEGAWADAWLFPIQDPNQEL